MWIEIIVIIIYNAKYCVTPFAGVWIEIVSSSVRIESLSHSLRGSVD